MPPTSLGQLRERVRIQTLVETVDQYGQPVQDWDQGNTIWARVRPPTGREQVNADQLKVQLSHIVTVRYRSAIQPSQQIIHKSRILRITHIEPDELRILMDLYCVEDAGEDDEDTE